MLPTRRHHHANFELEQKLMQGEIGKFLSKFNLWMILNDGMIHPFLFFLSTFQCTLGAAVSCSTLAPQARVQLLPKHCFHSIWQNIQFFGHYNVKHKLFFNSDASTICQYQVKVVAKQWRNLCKTQASMHLQLHQEDFRSYKRKI